MAVAVEEQRRVLVAEDDDLLRRALARLLRSRGHTVDEVANGRELVDRLRAQAYAALILDLELPPPSGRDVLRRCGGELRDTAVVVLSGGVDVQSTVELLREGVSDVVRKPASLDAVLARLGHALEGRPVAPGSPRPGRRPGRALLIGSSPAMHRIRASLEQISRFPDVSVLVQGETGTGKEVVARALHEATRPDEPFVGLNCAAVPEPLAESQLFGHEAGAFTSASGRREGVFEQAGSGTLFLDEIGEMAPALQVKLLRVLETRTFRRVGGDRELTVRARIVSATNRALRGADDSLRSDLFFRLAAFTIHTPPLRDRPEDVDQLARNFLSSFRARYPRVPARRITTRAVELLTNHEWPGNVRELRSVVEQMAMASTQPSLDAVDVSRALQAKSGPAARGAGQRSPKPVLAADGLRSSGGLGAWEREVITEAFKACDRNVSATARELGMARSTLRDRLRRYGLR